MELELEKPSAPIPLPFDSVSVCIARGWHRSFVALGSNMGDRQGYLDGAVQAVKEDPCIRIKKVSTYYVTAPYGGVEQEDFLNAAMELETLYTPEELLDVLHTLEQAAKRERLVHWGPRTLDLDILFYDDLVQDDSVLTLPHPDMQNRDFVLKPMVELAPHFVHPVFHQTMQQLLDALEWGARSAGTGEECGGFLQVAGITYKIDTEWPESTQKDDKGVWIGAPTGGYRVHSVEVYNKETNA